MPRSREISDRKVQNENQQDQHQDSRPGLLLLGWRSDCAASKISFVSDGNGSLGLVVRNRLPSAVKSSGAVSPATSQCEHDCP